MGKPEGEGGVKDYVQHMHFLLSSAAVPYTQVYKSIFEESIICNRCGVIDAITPQVLGHSCYLFQRKDATPLSKSIFLLAVFQYIERQSMLF